VLQVRFAGSFPAGVRREDLADRLSRPGSYAPRAVGGLWREMGGELGGQVRDGRVPAGLKPAFEFESPPLAEVIRDINKYSNNVMAQQLFLTLSLRSAAAAPSRLARGAAAWWRERFGGEPPVTENGSGLSRGESITARQLGQLLQAAWALAADAGAVSSLPALGLDGTLRRSAERRAARRT
jgi:D-alanyl-D-alanine carboxypeptidase/D-alanyl-D-alanine-endopeptidase (penicillin-binding protein 4)